MRIKLKQWAFDNGIKLTLNAEGKVKVNDSPELLEVCKTAIMDGVCPPLCDECSEVEPDGHCEHGAPSLLLALGMI